MPATVSAGNMSVHIPVPKVTSHVSHELPPATGQTVEFKAADKIVLWHLKKVGGGTEQYVRLKLTVPDAKAPILRKEISQVALMFEMPMFVCSRLAIRFLRVFERGRSYVPYRWVRYVTRSDSYVCRV